MGRYLPQLDGLRTVAVLLVIGFHLGLIHGGYVGVDVFFVLSGYLITTILVNERETGRWSIRSFYLRRMRRLYPALTVLLVLLLPWASQVVQGTPTHHALAWLAVGTYAADFVGGWNIGWLGGLAHTWSLGVEEQFYLLWPLVLSFFVRNRRQLVLLTGVLLGLLCVGPHALFYLPPRGGVILLGCGLAVMLRDRPVPQPMVVGVGSLVLLAGVVGLAPAASSRGAGAASALAGIASVGVIASLTQTTSLSNALGRRPLAWVGERSYGLYLWHLPLISILAVVGVATLAQTIEVGALSVLLAALSYRFIEVPVRRGRIVPSLKRGTATS